MNYEEFIKFKTQEYNRKNLEEFATYINSSAGKLKVKNFIEKNSDLNIQNILQDALSGNPYAIAILRKNPTRQNISENAFFEYTGIQKLPQVGSEAIRFNDSKAADFKIGEWYGTQKYLQQCGGAQDNQIADAVYFAKNGNKLGYKIIVCIDGQYGKSAIKKYLTENENCCIITADKLLEEINNGRFKENPAFYKAT